MDDIDVRLIVTVGVVLFSAASAWFAVKYGLADVRKEITNLGNHTDAELAEIKLDAKEARKNNDHQWKAMSEQGSITSRIDTEFKYLTRDVDRLTKRMDK